MLHPNPICNSACTCLWAFSPLFSAALNAARLGASLLRNQHLSGRRQVVSSKGPTDYVTELDREVERQVFDCLKAQFPMHSYLGEETGLQRGRGHQARFCWVLDPLDGTANFIHGFPHFALSLALEIEEVAEHAIVIDPLRSEEFTATRGRGAMCNDRRLRVSSHPDLDDSLLANSSHRDSQQPSHDNLGTLKQLYQHDLIVRRTGSAALDMAYTAAGRLEGFWGSGLHHWDLAAGLLLVVEAGGFCSGYTRSEDPRRSGRIICAARGCFTSLRQAVRDHLSDSQPASPLKDAAAALSADQN